MLTLKDIQPYYEDGMVTLYNANAYTLAIPDGSLWLTDPPYALTATGGGIGAKRQYLSDIAGHIDMGFDMNMLNHVPNWMVFCGKHQLKELLAHTGDRLWSLVTWNKTNPTPLVNSNYLPDTEYIVHAYTSGRLFGEYKDRSRFIVHPVEQNPYNHPTVKPMAVVSKMLRLGSQAGETVVDPFCGTGTTLIAAKLLGRKAIGIEINESYCNIAAQRCSQSCFAF